MPEYVALLAKRNAAVEQGDYGLAYGALLKEQHKLLDPLTEAVNDLIDRRLDERLAELGLIRDRHDL
jgi:hypothetical protein